MKGIPLRLREDSLVQSQDCCDLRRGQMDKTVYWICRFLEIKTSCNAYFPFAFELGQGRRDL